MREQTVNDDERSWKGLLGHSGTLLMSKIDKYGIWRDRKLLCCAASREKVPEPTGSHVGSSGRYCEMHLSAFV
jgi:hypothetical protein